MNEFVDKRLRKSGFFNGGKIICVYCNGKGVKINDCFVLKMLLVELNKNEVWYVMFLL